MPPARSIPDLGGSSLVSRVTRCFAVLGRSLRLPLWETNVTMGKSSPWKSNHHFSSKGVSSSKRNHLDKGVVDLQQGSCWTRNTSSNSYVCFQRNVNGDRSRDLSSTTDDFCEGGQPTSRIIIVTKWLVTRVYSPFKPFGRGTTLLRGLPNHDYYNGLLSGMIL